VKNHGTVLTLDVFSDDEFPDAVKTAWQEAGKRFGYGAPLEHFFQVEVKFLACSRWGDVYVVHVTDPNKDETASVRLTQANVRHGDSYRPLGTP
jgi:hypothetical protein